MELKRLPHRLTICKVADVSNIDLGGDLVFVGKTDEEVSLVCATEGAPEKTLEREDDWRAFRIEGVLDFSLVGVLSDISGTLAGEGIGIFAISTYNTDYILMKEEDFDRAAHALKDAGHTVS